MYTLLQGTESEKTKEYVTNNIPLLPFCTLEAFYHIYLMSESLPQNLPV